MSRGLILAGLGQGISNATSQIGNMMMRQNEEDRRDAREEARDMRRIQAAEDREEQLKQRMISEVAAAREGGAQIGRERMAGQVLAASGSQMAGESPVMDQAEFANILRDNPEYEQIYRQAGLVTDAMDPRLQTISDQYDAALGAGAHSSVLDAFEKQRSAVLQQIREERTDRREDERERSNRAMEELRQQQFELTARTQALRDSRQSAQELRTSYSNHLTLIEGLRKSIQDDRRALQATHKNELASARPSEREALRARHSQEMARFDPMLQTLDADRNWIRGQLGMPTGNSNSGDNTRTQSGPGTLPEPKSRAELEELAPGTRYKAPDGTIRTKS